MFPMKQGRQTDRNQLGDSQLPKREREREMEIMRERITVNFGEEEFL